MSAEYTRQEAAHYEAIRQHERFVEQMAMRHEMLKRTATLAREQHKHAVARLHELIAEDPAQMTLPGMEGELMERTAIPGWRDTPVSVVVSDKSILEKLASHAIATIGQLGEYTNSDHSLTSLGLT